MREVDEALARAYAQHEQGNSRRVFRRPALAGPRPPMFPRPAIASRTCRIPRSSSSGPRSYSLSSANGANALKRWPASARGAAAAGHEGHCSSPVVIGQKVARRWC